jgi:hypothetical protein
MASHNSKISRIRIRSLIPLLLRVDHYFLSRPFVRWPGIIVLTLIVPIILAWLAPSVPFINNLFNNNTFAVVFSALFGGVIGAVVGGIISYFIQIKQFLSQAAITKKNDIYKPLYKSLVDLRDILGEKPYPKQISDGMGGAFGSLYPDFGLWQEFKKDGRYVEIPKWLIKEFEEYEKAVSKYPLAISRATDDVHQHITVLVAGKVGKDSSRVFVNNRQQKELTSLLIPDIILQEQLTVAQIRVDSYLEKIPDVSYEQREELRNEIYKEYCRLPAIEDLRRAFDECTMRVDQLLQDVEYIMRYISYKFETQGDRF